MSDVPLPKLTLNQLRQCPAMIRHVDHWREDGTCLHYPEGFDIDTAPECGVQQLGGMAVCRLKVPIAHVHFWFPDGDGGGVRWQTGHIDVGGQR